MFSIFKRKQNLTPKDVSSGLLTSNFVSINIGENLEISENTICFIRYKDKTYKELTTGKYSLNKEFLLDLYTKQLKGKDKIKTLKADLYFVNLNSFNFEFEYIDKIPLNKIKEKFLINVKFNVQVADAKAFLKSLIYENTAPTAETSKNLIIQYTENILRNFYLRKSLESTNVDTNKINHIVSKEFKKIGLNATIEGMELFKKTNNKTKKQSKTPNKPVEKEEIKTEHTKETEKVNNLEQIENLPKAENVCPNCNSKLISGSIFCHKCGYRK